MAKTKTQVNFIKLPLPTELNNHQERQMRNRIWELAVSSGEYSHDGYEVVEGSKQLWWWEGEYVKEDGSYYLHHFGISVKVGA